MTALRGATTRTAATILFGLGALLLASCWGGGDPSVGGETNWLVMCTAQRDCGPLSCLCGVCTRTCDDDCGDLGDSAQCVSSSEGSHGQLCAGSDEAPVALCLQRCAADADCKGGSCVEGACVPQTASGRRDASMGGDGDGDGDGTTAGGPCEGVVDKLDLLFVIDDSQSMAQEQAALRAQMPTFIGALVDGGARDLHVGVVSTDMGLVDVQGVPACADGLGDDGRLQNLPSPEADGCEPLYPTFLTFSQGDDVGALAGDLACIGTLGTEGCGFEQPLEAALKALWPAIDIDPATGQPWVDPFTGEPGNRITFLPDAMGQGTYGHGDGANVGFLRNDGGATPPSMIAVVVVTDEEDCSSASTRHFTPPQYLPDGDPLKEQSMNLRCFLNDENLYSLARYINGLRALRPGNEQLVVFGAIAGVPADLTSNVGMLDDDDAREAYYAGLLDDPRMIERVDESEPDAARRNLVPSCQSENGVAFPPRRIMEVARGFGRNGLVQSICEQDLASATDNLAALIVRRMGDACR